MRRCASETIGRSQASVAIGIMVGYLVGGMFVLNFGTAHWLVTAVYFLQTLRGLLDCLCFLVCLDFPCWMLALRMHIHCSRCASNTLRIVFRRPDGILLQARRKLPK